MTFNMKTISNMINFKYEHKLKYEYGLKYEDNLK